MDDSNKAASSSTTATTSFVWDDDVAAVVLDGGSLFFKAGFAGDDAPRAVFLSVVNRYMSSHFTLYGGRNTLVGDDAIARKNDFGLVHPIDRGLITDWDKMEKV